MFVYPDRADIYDAYNEVFQHQKNDENMASPYFAFTPSGDKWATWFFPVNQTNPTRDNDPVYKQMPTHFRAEMHDRLVAPLYPIAFAVICFAILGAPRTSRQSREMSLIMTIVAVGGLRLIGFACNVLGTQSAIAFVVLYASLLIAFALGLFAIARGLVFEPPAFLTQPTAGLFERLSRRLAPA